MNNKDKTTEYLESLKGMKLSETARERIERELSDYADFHAVSTDPVRVSDASRSSERAATVTIWHTLFVTRTRTTMPFIAIVAVVLIGGGTSLAAESSVPGDALYAVKTGVNEQVKSAFAFGAEAEARLQAELLAERVAEAEELKAEGRLEGELAMQVATGIEEQAEVAEEASDDAEATVEVETDSMITLSLSRFASLIGGDTSLAINTKLDSRDGNTGGNGNTRVAMDMQESASGDADMEMGYGGGVDADATMSTMLALEPVSIDELYKNTKERIASLRDVLERHESEIRASVYAEYTATLDDAAELFVQIDAGVSEDEARELLYEASELAGKVESALSLMGEVRIDTDTGAIIDIDFSNPPPAEPDRGDADSEPMPLPMPPEVLEMDGEAGLEATSEISL